MHLTDKYKNIRSYDNYLNADSNNELAEFHYKFKFNDNYIEYLYGKKSINDIAYEKVLINGKTVISFDRHKDKEIFIDLEGADTLNKDLNQNKISAVKYIKTNTNLAKSNDNNIILNDFFNFVDNMLLFKSLDERIFMGYETTATPSILNDIIDKGHFEDFMNFLKNVNLDDWKLKVIDINGAKNVFFDFKNRDIEFISAASTGTKCLSLFYYWFQKLKFEKSKPSLIFIDEFDAFYHMAISEHIVKILKEFDNQIILTTHDTNLLSNDILRPDCYFLMQKNKIEPLSNLTDKELRAAHNIEKMYKAGVFSE